MTKEIWQKFEGLIIGSSKFIGALMVIFAFTSGAFVQVIGPGLWEVSGMQGFEDRVYRAIDNKISEQKAGFDAQFLNIQEDVDFLIDNMDPPRVVDWNEQAAKQVGSCTIKRCIYQFAGARTAFGESCGTPVAHETFPEIRLTAGNVQRIAFADDWRPVTLGRRERTFNVSLSDFEGISTGKYLFRVRILYPSCEGKNEPVPRYTSWQVLEFTELEQ